MATRKLKLYGADWCIKSAKIRNYLQSVWVEFDDLNVEKDQEAEQQLRAFYEGELKFPTVSYEEQFLKNPSIPELKKFLNELKLMEE